MQKAPLNGAEVGKKNSKWAYIYIYIYISLTHARLVTYSLGDFDQVMLYPAMNTKAGVSLQASSVTQTKFNSCSCSKYSILSL